MHASRLTQRTKLALVLTLSIGMATVMMLGLPLLYLTLPNPSVEELVDVAGNGRGMYLQADGQSYRLFPRARRLAKAAADIPVVHQIDRVLVVVRQHGELDSYTIRAIGGPEVGVEVSTAGEGELTAVLLKPKQEDLAPATYEVSVPRESMFGGEDYVYFTVTR